MSKQSLFTRIKNRAKHIPVIYYPVHYMLSRLKYAKSFIRWKIYKFTVKFNRNGLNTTEKRSRKIIASLTSYPARINIVPYVIASLLKQTMKPDKLILWLAESQFPDKKLPPIFDEVKACGVEVRFCPEDIGPHKKYYYAMKEFPEDIIITFDDDMIYKNYVIETLYRSYLEHPESVSAMSVDRMKFLPDGSLANYLDFDFEYKAPKGVESYHWVASSGSGTLFPPSSKHTELFNTDNMMKLCPTYDEMWLKFTEVMSGIKVVHAWDYTFRKSCWIVVGTQSFSLHIYHFSTGQNAKQMRAVIDAYSDWRDTKGRTLLEVIRDD